MRARTVIVGTIAVAVVGSAVALAGWGGGQRAGCGGGPGEFGFFEHRLQCLGLSEAQRAKVDAIVAETRPSIAALREQLRTMRQSYRATHTPGTFDEAAIRAEMAKRAAIHTELAVKLAKARADIFAVLTPEQQQQLAQMRERWEEVGRGRCGRGRF
jgi:protein CpxP